MPKQWQVRASWVSKNRPFQQTQKVGRPLGKTLADNPASLIRRDGVTAEICQPDTESSQGCQVRQKAHGTALFPIHSD
jgi:hypothetical protein